jgi:outer membrane protein assembly factor BamD (BamD/ComL family)
MRWIGSNKFLPDYVNEIFTFQQIINIYHNRMPSQAFPLADAFIKKFPNSRYNAEIKRKMAQLVEQPK